MTQKYQIKELGTEATYIELRILTYIECEEKIKVITEILNFLNAHNFLTNLTMLYHVNMRAENMVEHQNCASLTIDMRDERFRFKYYDGAQTYWTYHVQDLCDILIEGRESYQQLVARYRILHQLMFEFREKYRDSIYSLTYTYYPSDEIDVLYEIQFESHMKEQQAMVDTVLKDLYAVMSEKMYEDLKFDIDYTFKTNCIPCQKAKEKGENEKLTK